MRPDTCVCETFYVRLKCTLTFLGVLIDFILGWLHEGLCPTSGAQNSCHGNGGCLATGLGSLRFVSAYFGSAKTYELQNREVYSALVPGGDVELIVDS